MSSKKPSASEDLFSNIPPQEHFDAFPTLAAFPENAIAFLTGKTSKAPDVEPAHPDSPEAQAPQALAHSISATPAAAGSSPVREPAAPRPRVASKTRPVSKPDSRPHSQPVNQPDSRSASHSADHKGGLSASPSASRTQDHTLDQTQGLATSQAASRSHGATDPESRRTTGAVAATASKDIPERGPALPACTPADRLNANQRRVLELLLATKPYIVKFRDIAAALGMREASVRTIMRRLMALSCLSFAKARDGNIQGVRVVIDEHVAAHYRQDLSLSQSQDQTAGHTPGLTRDLSADQPDSQPHSRPDLLLREKEREYLSFEEHPFGWTETMLATVWPRLHRAGCGLEQIRQAAAIRASLGKPLDRELVAVSLDRADWELEARGCLTELSTGEAVRNPAAYVFTALSRWGALRAHPDYVSREEQALREASDELSRRQKAAAEREALAFAAYAANLTSEAKAEAMRDFPGGSREAWLKRYWRDNVRDVAASGPGMSGD